MSKSLITENRTLRAKIHRLEKENLALRKECSEACHETLIEQMRQRFGIPKWLLSERSYEVLARKDFAGIEKYMADRARMFSDKPKIVSKEV